jgi:hypothetical protein
VFVRTRFSRQQNHTTPQSPTNTLLDEGDSDVIEHTFRLISLPALSAVSIVFTSAIHSVRRFVSTDSTLLAIRMSSDFCHAEHTSQQEEVFMPRPSSTPLRRLYFNLYRNSFLPQLSLSYVSAGPCAPAPFHSISMYRIKAFVPWAAHITSAAHAETLTTTSTRAEEHLQELHYGTPRRNHSCEVLFPLYVPTQALMCVTSWHTGARLRIQIDGFRRVERPGNFEQPDVLCPY